METPGFCHTPSGEPLEGEERSEWRTSGETLDDGRGGGAVLGVRAMGRTEKHAVCQGCATHPQNDGARAPKEVGGTPH